MILIDVIIVVIGSSDISNIKIFPDEKELCFISKINLNPNPILFFIYIFAQNMNPETPSQVTTKELVLQNEFHFPPSNKPFECKICLEPSSSTQNLIKPCRCSGSLKYVHQQCLMEWFYHKGNSEVNNFLCEICNTEMRVKKDKKIQCCSRQEIQGLISEKLKLFWMIFIMLWFQVGILLYLIYRFSDIEKRKKSETKFEREILSISLIFLTLTFLVCLISLIKMYFVKEHQQIKKILNYEVEPTAKKKEVTYHLNDII